MPNQNLTGMNEKFAGKRAFITGAGSGLGLSFALELAKLNWTIGITDVDKDRLRLAAAAIENAGGSPKSYVFDVADYAEFAKAVIDFDDSYGGIDIGINNAGVGCAGLLHETSIELFRKVIDINLMGVVNGCHLFVPIMRRQRSGHILNIASAAAFVSAPTMSAYNVSKAGVLSLSETLRAELNDEGVLVSVLMPTYVRTNIGNDSLGTTEGKRHAHLLVEESKIIANDVARETLEKMHRGVFYIIMPNQARFLWRFKRLMPDAFAAFIVKEVKKKLLSLRES